MKTLILLLVAILTFGGIPTIYPLPLTINGTKATEGQFPYLVSIQTLKEGHICGGSIINKRWILTAAHCISYGKIQIESNQLRILAGTIHLNQGGVRYNVEKIILHPDYDADVIVGTKLIDVRNDIALLKVAQDIKFNNLTSSIPLSSPETPANSIVISGGWGNGTDPHLRFLELYVVPTKLCSIFIPQKIYEICTRSTTIGKKMSNGDSGGPLVYNGKIVGVFSSFSYILISNFQFFCYYTKVTSFKNWINEKIGQ